MSKAAEVEEQELPNDVMPGDELDLGEGEESGEEGGDQQESAPEAGAAASEPAKYSAETLALIAGDDKPHMIPKSRFDEVNTDRNLTRARLLELEEENARLKGGSAAAPKAEEPAKDEFDFDAAEDLYSAAILDGDQTKARAIRADIRKQEQQAADARAEAAADRRYQANRAKDDEQRNKEEFGSALVAAYESFPFLDSESDGKNQDAIDETLALLNLYKSRGQSPAKALAAAAAKVGPRYAETKPETASGAAGDVKPDLNKGLARAAQIPPSGGGKGAATIKMDVNKMTGDDIKKMSPEDRARLEGDLL